MFCAWMLLSLGIGGVAGLTWLPEHGRTGLAAELMPHLLPPTPGDDRVSGSEHKFLAVPLDHSKNATDKRMFNLTYFVDDGVWDRENGPIFVSMGQEGPTGGAQIGPLHVAHKALSVAVEHRFYGQSIPFNDRSVETLKYLKVEQNLADTAAVVEHIQASLSKRRVVANFGGSYSGATAAWFREKYPDITHAASSSSGVVNAILDFVGFDEQIAVAADLPKAGCTQKLRDVTRAFENAFASGIDEWNEAKKVMGAPNLIGTALGDDDFWYMIADSAAMAVQYGHKEMLCEALDVAASGTNKEKMANFANFTAKFWGKDFASGCFYDSECLKDNSRTDMSRSWRWQKCTELAYLQPGYQGSVRHTNLTLSKLIKQCKYVFGSENIAADCNTGRTNKYFGGATMDGEGGLPTKIVFLDFSDDPWQRASVQHALSPELPYCMTTCNGCGHCGAGVPPTVKHCKDVEAEYISKWIAAAQEKSL